MKSTRIEDNPYAGIEYNTATGKFIVVGQRDSAYDTLALAIAARRQWLIERRKQRHETATLF